MPIALGVGIVIDPHWRAESRSAIGATHKHHISCAAPWREHAGQHVNVVVSGRPGTVHCQKTLPSQSNPIYAALAQVAAHVDRRRLVECRSLAAVLRIAGAKAPEIK